MSFAGTSFHGGPQYWKIKLRISSGKQLISVYKNTFPSTTSFFMPQNKLFLREAVYLGKSPSGLLETQMRGRSSGCAGCPAPRCNHARGSTAFFPFLTQLLQLGQFLLLNVGLHFRFHGLLFFFRLHSLFQLT